MGFLRAKSKLNLPKESLKVPPKSPKKKHLKETKSARKNTQDKPNGNNCHPVDGLSRGRQPTVDMCCLAAAPVVPERSLWHANPRHTMPCFFLFYPLLLLFAVLS